MITPPGYSLPKGVPRGVTRDRGKAKKFLVWSCEYLKAIGRLARCVRLDGEQVSQHLALAIAVHRAVGRRIEYLLALPWRHLAQHAEGSADLLLARRIHVAEFLRGVAHGLASIGTQALHVLDAAQCALTLLRRHGVQLMQTIDEALLLRLRQTVEARLATQCVFLASEGLSLMALQPAAQMGARHICRRTGVWAARRLVRHTKSIRWAGSRPGRRCHVAVGRAGVGRWPWRVAGRDPMVRRATIGWCSIGRLRVR
jgi:hypothetical protein